ncbi:MAG TPA: ASKHA domain-containing protein [Spirochaetota bacterium]|nr:ASKHA domain-containing protein [Spirochaetota bacterium]
MALNIKIKNNTYTIPVNKNKSILELTKANSIFIKTSCGGKGNCGSCTLYLRQGKFSQKGVIIEPENKKALPALACMTRVISPDAEIEIPQTALIELSGKISADFNLKDYEKNCRTKKFLLHIPAPALGSQNSQRHCLEQELYKQTSIKNIFIPLDVLNLLPEVSENNKVSAITVTLGSIKNFWFMINLEKGDTTGIHYAIAVDIGTTTVAAILVDMENGRIAGRSTLYNQQITVADDVISRIDYCKNRKNVARLQQLVINKTINPLIKELCREAKVNKNEINRISLSGNTVMLHLLLGINPRSIGTSPFQPVTLTPGQFQAKEIGLNIIKNGIVDIIPSVSGYIGGDIVADIYTSRIHQEDKLTLLIDIGTNGEIVMCDKQKMLACSTAAGPAFEGYGLHNGCRAANGAVEKIFFDKQKQLHTSIIGNGKAGGICGTGIIDFIAAARRMQLINKNGRYRVERLQELQLYYEFKNKEGKKIKSCIIVPAAEAVNNEPIIVTEHDVVKIMQAKAAIYAGLKTLLQIKQKKWQDITKIILTGGFAKHINIPNAVTIGLLPDVEPSCYELVGNGSLAGSFLALTEPNAMEKMTALAFQPEVIELNTCRQFQEFYIDALFLPEPR